MAIGLLFALTGVVVMNEWHKQHVLVRFDRLSGALQAQQCFLVFEIVAGVLLLVLAAPRGKSSRVPYGAGGGQVPGWGPVYGAVPGVAGVPYIYGAPGTPGTYGVPGAAGASGVPGAAPGGWGGYGHPVPGRPVQQPPSVGGFGPPPEFPPPSGSPGTQPGDAPGTPPPAPGPPAAN
jgi:hypothetical protein